MAFKSSGIDFAKLLWEQHRIKYGPKGSYTPYPRQWKTTGILDGKVSPLSLCVKTGSDGIPWVYVEEGGVTGYESARLETLWYHHNDWTACAGGMGWSQLIIKKKQLIPILREMKDYINF